VYYVLVVRRTPSWLRPQSLHTTCVALRASDFYNILGVSQTASQDEIKRAYYQVDHYGVKQFQWFMPLS